MSNNSVFLRTDDYKKISGQLIVRFEFGYYDCRTIPEMESKYGSEVRYDRLVNMREGKAIRNTDNQSAIQLAIIAQRWTHITPWGEETIGEGKHPYPVYAITPQTYSFYGTTFRRHAEVMGFIGRSGYKYSFIEYSEAPSIWRKACPRSEEDQVRITAPRALGGY